MLGPAFICQGTHTVSRQWQSKRYGLRLFPSTSRSTLALFQILGSLCWDIWCKDCAGVYALDELPGFGPPLQISRHCQRRRFMYLALHGLGIGPFIVLVVRVWSMGSGRGQLISMVRSKLFARPSAVRGENEHSEHTSRSRSLSDQFIDSVGFQMHA